jgi:hypothetical protein
MPPRRKITPEKRQEIIALGSLYDRETRKPLYRLDEVGKMTGESTTTVGLEIRRAGMEREKRRMSPYNRNTKIIEMSTSINPVTGREYTYKEIGAKFGLKAGTIRGIIYHEPKFRKARELIRAREARKKRLLEQEKQEKNA